LKEFMAPTGTSNKIFSMLRGGDDPNGAAIKFFNHLPKSTDGQNELFIEAVRSEGGRSSNGFWGDITNESSQRHLTAVFNIYERPSKCV
jgi:hypothetical protein